MVNIQVKKDKQDKKFQIDLSRRLKFSGLTLLAIYFAFNFDGCAPGDLDLAIEKLKNSNSN